MDGDQQVPAPASAATATEARLDRLEGLLNRLLEHTTNRAASPASDLPDPGPSDGPGLFYDIHPGTKSVLRPNPPFVFDGDRAKGRSFLHSVRQYARLLPEAFLDAGEPSEVKVVRFAMTFMSTGAAQHWAECQSNKTIFPFVTWDGFVSEFKLRFIAENEQDHALQKLETREYFMGSRDVFAYTDDFEDLAALAGYTDPLVKVTKYRSGLAPAINQAITASGDPPSLRDYTGWRARAYRQYDALERAKASGTPSRAPAHPPAARPRVGVFPALRPAAAPAPVPAPAAPPAPRPLPPGVPMDIDRTRARVGSGPRRCYRCGEPGHLANTCTAPADVRVTDVLDEVIRQLGGDLLEELVARVATSGALPEAEESEASEGFVGRDE